MRKGLLVVVLVAASFAGGTAFKGPLPGWVQGLLRSGPRVVGAEKAQQTAQAGPTGAEGSAPEVREIPAAPSPSLVPDEFPEPRAQADRNPAKPPGPVAAALPPAVPAPPAPEPVDAPEAEAESVAAAESIPPLSSPRTDGTEPPAPPAAAAPPPLDSSVAMASGIETRQSGASRTGSSAWVDAPEPVPTPVAGPGPVEPEPAGGQAAEPGGSGQDWELLHRRMRELGVSRYWIEGEPAAGIVRFRCVIPLAGAQAVGQQFEVEGRDEWQAATIALGRVALWKATEAEVETEAGAGNLPDLKGGK